MVLLVNRTRVGMVLLVNRTIKVLRYNSQITWFRQKKQAAAMAESLHIIDEKPWRVLEFYSGIGGMVTISFTSDLIFLFFFFDSKTLISVFRFALRDTL